MLDDELTSRVMYREIYRFDGQDRDILHSYMQGTSQKDISEKLGYILDVVRKTKVIFNQFFDYAVQNKFVQSNPTLLTRVKSK